MKHNDITLLLTRLARNAIARELGLQQQLVMEELPILRERRGLFVTLKQHGALRGCIGSLVATEAVAEGVRRHACNAAFHDHRFKPLRAEELAHITMCISLLSEPEPLCFASPEELCKKLKPLHDGVILRHPSGRTATFLPQVWEQLPTAEEFLAALARKAGLPALGWQDPGVTISTYQAEIYDEGQVQDLAARD